MDNINSTLIHNIGNLHMPEYRRHRIPGGTYFITIVTYQRQPILTLPKSREILRCTWKTVQSRYPFSTDAICLLPDHIHTLITLPENDGDFPKRISEIKRIFSREFHLYNRNQVEKNLSRIKRRENTLWQRRYWDHIIRDEQDLNNHINYIHYNPVKHGLTTSVIDWPWSSFHRYVKAGIYEWDWGSDVKFDDNTEFGE
jgi:putative transposase